MSDYQRVSEKASKISDLKDSDYKRQEIEEVAAEGNGVYGTALAIISTIMGGGIVSIPFAYAVAGIAVGLTVQVCVIITVWISCQLYL